ncbi:hypothetical protein [Streptomyces longisporus]|uniref:wHTH domain-containing protein n=1 Tax=Streptomyces longisporus TaxID=1948 RepID=UPI003CD0784F
MYVNRLSRDHDGQWPWVSSVGPPPWQLVAAQGWLSLTADDVRAERASGQRPGACSLRGRCCGAGTSPL